MESSLNQALGSAWGQNTADPANVYIFVGIFALILVIVVTYSIRSGSMGGNRDASFNLRGTCRTYGLETTQYKVLRTAIRKQKLANPASLFTNGRYLNTCLKRIISEIEASNLSQGQKEILKSEIFDIKQKIAMTIPPSDKKMTSRGVPINQPAVIFSRTFPPFRTEIAGKTASWVVMEMPRDSHGDFVQYKPGEPVKVQYVKNEDKVFTFVSKVNDIREVEGEMRLLLEHSENVKQVQLRRSPRKEFRRAVYFYKVEITEEGKGKRAKKHASVNKNKRFGGTMTDISAGGCAIITRSPLPKGGIIMISFDINDGNTVNVFGKIRATQRDRTGTLMRIAFTKVSTKTMNEIKSLVFGFADEEDVPKNKYLLH